MATLEVHDDQERVQFVELTRDHPLLFGTSAACDVVLSGEGILPVHGRIRWKKHRYRVDASPDAEYVVINGHKMSSSSLHQGDEMEVGSYRIFLLRLDDEAETSAPARRKARPDDDKTRVLERPLPHTHTAPPVETKRKKSPARPAPQESLLERAAWLEALEIPNDSPESSAATVEPEHLADKVGRTRAKAPKKSRDLPLPRALSGLISWFRGLRTAQEGAPGQERLFNSPLVIGLLLSLVLLVGMGFWLNGIIHRTIATRTYNHAIELLEDGDYRTAIRDFDVFMAANPKDNRVDKARVLRALANVRQYISVSGATWSSALEAAREMYEGVGDAEAFRDERPELAELVIKIGEGLADRSRRNADPKSLAEAESVVPLHAAIAGEPAPAFLNRSRLPGLLSEARQAVRKAQIRAEALARMDLAATKGTAAGVYQARDVLLDQYADLATDPELLKRMLQANELIRVAVTVDTTHRSADKEPRPQPLGPATSLVLRSSLDAPPATPSPESLAFALADGMAYGLDATSGAPLWQVPVGLSSPFIPLAVAGDPTVLVVDARHHDLLRLDSRSGKLVWRLALGERVESPPLVVGNQLFQVLPSGKLMVITLETGELQASLNLGLSLSQTPVNDESGQFLYVLGRKDCLFVVAREPLSCVKVEYLGHSDGSIPCPPARLGRFLIVAENDRATDSRWRVLVLDEEGVKPRAVQEINVAGWTWATPAAAGSVIWATGDKGGVEAFAIGDYSSKTPFRSLARLNPDANPSGPAFALALSEREIWTGASRSGRYVLDPEHGEFASSFVLNQTGSALAPLQIAAQRVVSTFQDSETGGTALWALDAGSGAVAWRTILGASWPIPLEIDSDGKTLKTIGRTGSEAKITQSLLNTGGFVPLPLPRPGEPQIPSGQLLTLEGEGPAVSVIVDGPGSNLLWVQEPEKASAWRRVELPTVLASTPLVWGRALLIPGRDGRAYLIDPLTGESRAEPLVPVYNRDRPGHWQTPVRLDHESVVLADDAGRVRRLTLKSSPVPRLIIETETALDKGLIADPASTGRAVIVVTADRRVRALAARDLSPVGAWRLDAPLAGNPVVVGEHCFIFDTAQGVLVLGPDGQRLWSIKLDALAASPPVIQGDSILLLDRAGYLHRRALADGSARARVDLGVFPVGGLISVGSEVFVPVGRGTIQSVAIDRILDAKP